MSLRARQRTSTAVIWLILLTAPYWINWVGGYTPLGSRVLVLALAAMSLNFLLGFTGVLAAGMLGLQPTIGLSLIMPSFVAIIVGGLGSLPGTLVGGLLIGIASGMTTVFFPAATEAVMYVMMALVLLVRPRGLLGEQGRLH